MQPETQNQTSTEKPKREPKERLSRADPQQHKPDQVYRRERAHNDLYPAIDKLLETGRITDDEADTLDHAVEICTEVSQMKALIDAMNSAVIDVNFNIHDYIEKHLPKPKTHRSKNTKKKLNKRVVDDDKLEIEGADGKADEEEDDEELDNTVIDAETGLTAYEAKVLKTVDEALKEFKEVAARPMCKECGIRTQTTGATDGLCSPDRRRLREKRDRQLAAQAREAKQQVLKEVLEAAKEAVVYRQKEAVHKKIKALRDIKEKRAKV